VVTLAPDKAALLRRLRFMTPEQRRATTTPEPGPEPDLSYWRAAALHAQILTGRWVAVRHLRRGLLHPAGRASTPEGEAHYAAVDAHNEALKAWAEATGGPP
jgi:hypothetical protein